MARDLSPRELADSVAALAIRPTEEEGLDVVESPGGVVWLRFISGWKVLGMNPVSPDDLVRLGNDLIGAADVARRRRFTRRAEQN